MENRNNQVCPNNSDFLKFKKMDEQFSILKILLVSYSISYKTLSRCVRRKIFDLATVSIQSRIGGMHWDTGEQYNGTTGSSQPVVKLLLESGQHSASGKAVCHTDNNIGCGTKIVPKLKGKFWWPGSLEQ